MSMEYLKKPLGVGILGCTLLGISLDVYAQKNDKDQHPKYFTTSTRIMPTDHGFVIIQQGRGSSTSKTYTNPYRNYALKVEPHRDRVEITTRNKSGQATSTFNYQKTAQGIADSISAKLKNLKEKGLVLK